MIARRFAWVFALVVASSGLPAHAAFAAPIVTPAGLQAGDQFRLVFVSSETRNATSADLAEYDAFIAALAVASGVDTYFDEAVTWRALGSTETTDAIDRLPSDFASPALYRLDGKQVAPSTGLLWVMGTTGVPITVTETGDEIGSSGVWTGTDRAGMAFLPLGSSEVAFGDPVISGAGWIAQGPAPSALRFHLYGYSSVLTVPEGTVPEPEKLTLLLAALGACMRRARRSCGRHRRPATHRASIEAWRARQPATAFRPD